MATNKQEVTLLQLQVSALQERCLKLQHEKESLTARLIDESKLRGMQNGIERIEARLKKAEEDEERRRKYKPGDVLIVDGRSRKLVEVSEDGAMLGFEGTFYAHVTDWHEAKKVQGRCASVPEAKKSWLSRIFS